MMVKVPNLLLELTRLLEVSMAGSTFYSNFPSYKVKLQLEPNPMEEKVNIAN